MAANGCKFDLHAMFKRGIGCGLISGLSCRPKPAGPDGIRQERPHLGHAHLVQGCVQVCAPAVRPVSPSHVNQPQQTNGIALRPSDAPALLFFLLSRLSITLIYRPWTMAKKYGHATLQTKCHMFLFFDSKSEKIKIYLDQIRIGFDVSDQFSLKSFKNRKNGVVENCEIRQLIIVF
jgi:hypothetical protein